MEKLKLMVLLFFSGFYIPGLMAQQTVPAAGGDASGSSGTSSYTIGQVVYTVATGPDGTVSQGIQQPYEFATLGNDDFPEMALIMRIYPNPTTSFVNLKIQDYSANYENDDMEYILFDVNGRQLSIGKITAEETRIPMKTYPSAAYLLNVIGSGKLLKTFKIVKNY